MNISDLYPFMRLTLGDRAVSGEYDYAEGDLLSAVRWVFAEGLNPSAYQLDGTVFMATAITPDLATGDDLALVVYEACEHLVAGESGTMSYRTRELSVTEAGDRKRDILDKVRRAVHRIRNGASLFSTWQSFTAFISAEQGIGDFQKMTYNSTPPDLAV